MRLLVAAIAATASLASASAGEPASPAPAAQAFVPHPRDASKRIEIFVSRPAAARPAPAVVLLHGHNSGKHGAADLVEQGVLERMARRGWVAVGVSLPGYGRSDGPADYCGPVAQEAVLAVLRHVRAMPGVDHRRVALHGQSRGAVVAAMVAARDPDLAALVLIVPIYDLGRTYDRLRALGDSEEARPVIAAIASEAGTDAAAFAERSPLAVAGKIKAPTLVLAGALDPRIGADEPAELGDRISANRVPTRVVVYPELGSSIPPHIVEPVVMGFLDKALHR